MCKRLPWGDDVDDAFAAPLVIVVMEFACSSASRTFSEVEKSVPSARPVTEDEVLLVDDCSRSNRLLAIPSAEKGDMAAPARTFEMNIQTQVTRQAGNAVIGQS